MAKIKGELINQKVTPCEGLSTYHVSGTISVTKNEL